MALLLLDDVWDISCLSQISVITGYAHFDLPFILELASANVSGAFLVSYPGKPCLSRSYYEGSWDLQQISCLVLAMNTQCQFVVTQTAAIIICFSFLKNKRNNI